MKSTNESHLILECFACPNANAVSDRIINQKSCEIDLYCFTNTRKIFANHQSVRFFSVGNSLVKNCFI